MTLLPNPATWLAGYIPDLPTPFDEAGALDLTAFAVLCERQIKAGVTAIVVGETAGEASTLTPAEHEAIVRAAVGIARGRVRVIAGAGSNSTSQAIELTRRAEAAGADAVLSVVPYYNKPMQSGIFAHFQAIADAATLPIILHDVPARTIRELSDDTLTQLARSKQFIGLRDATGDITRPMRLRSLLPHGFRLLSGDDATALAFIANGGDGCISTISNVAPELCLAVFSSCRQGRLQSARYLHNRLAALTSALSKESPAALKYALCLLGFMSPATRLPIVELADPAKAEVASAIAGIGDEDLGCPIESWRGPRLHADSPARL
ncbi:4-hydroxy-tetrahydrodipicolinate synthase [Bradyrhizobium sediminis]|uniref:4-hydroxy-tetrahydrodipicolinate synthase n=1 Tax=Bradyrhizobium sediminis TaxID=2840469 RepID=A0A975NRQ6_9BRAD|nr:4-hydroxy-tetrahydrodipicolinate synthase [Bradyrhizobium sediminis]QWG19461.1 4-hydroxy-tetrahydrodipicolinate synthase [Bradyrhizobium sediminis]